MFALEDIGQLAPAADERAKQTEALDARSGFESANETLRAVLRVAINHAASDIHLEMVDRRMRPRFRIDGVLQELLLGVLGEQINHDRVKILSRLKILSKLDIAEKRRPQDGSRAWIERAGQTASVDFRISIIPGTTERMRRSASSTPRLPQSVDALGLAGPVTTGLHQLLQSPTGIILVTGPTGSGKSTASPR